MLVICYRFSVLGGGFRSYFLTLPKLFFYVYTAYKYIYITFYYCCYYCYII